MTYMEHVVDGALEVISNIAQDKDQDKLFMFNNASWTLCLYSNVYNFQQLFPIGRQHIRKGYIHSNL